MSDPIHALGEPGSPASALGPRQRAAAWDRLGAEQFDVVVIGGGVVGSGCALDAATRGLKVALVEARDFASGTSSRSSKMFHGGLRYLEQLEFGLVREALYERELSLTTLAPHLVKPMPFLFPLTNRLWERPYIAAGIFLYDRLGGAKSVPAQKHLTRAGALRLCPGLKRSALIGGIRYYDTIVDDARHTLTVARTAAHYGVVVRNSTQVVALLREGDRVTGVRVRDSEDGSVTEVRGHVVVNATGVWTDEIQALSKQRGRFQVRASKGVHVVVPRDRIVSDVAIILRTEKSVMFVIPWGSHWIIGTTDTDWDLDLAHPAATKADIDYILSTVNTVLAIPLTHADIDGVYAGLRPLLAGESEETSKLSREHAVAVPAPGLVAIAGGKYTTYRVMAADAIDAAAQFIPARVAPSITEKVSLLGADGYCALINQAEHVAQLRGLHPYRVRHLLDRYGSLIGDVLALAADRPDLLNPITEAPGYLRVEALYAVTAEGALHLEDILARRMRISIEYSHRGVDCAREVADVVAPVLGWTAGDVEREVANYTARVQAEILSQAQPDDVSADELRASAPEARAEILEPVPLN
ncbi:glycerol-3-phosphate dehydrogenase/oxidase [Mycobacterium avium subsp. paratuberculosis]|uniref:Glycerol-3-phosphate dehydrogenase n=1 Tax=Mycolicibacterium paratuberculosis (strain ATCC BAA-968 / K-10) TaxID=262316 RepID=Q73UE5_MYCPA|nr:glycerol-3-phosphate dehydrogenase/oxidase [Mycobacterium avium]ELP44884.1 GlpD2 [Mycobacterium avium subsp. paratuberculosis S5]ETB06286.1 glycerol-3-phosphate dehydrogenase [Mycobacterium avium subsp. paratuberculosis 10-4404]ETB07893.1 glycerol-3-phosphate dehydrogenase [Mycobacterium avium subsp. paratuberculosis 10-5864]ETB36104.1 glycerol-3-phosphate dehydrogenase [Mycobacterium avium subsp. paratuberculosis 10-5975]AAS05973.1 GlpD2 [Mycobacterium avium subsp. paratuberculosis K-10]